MAVIDVQEVARRVASRAIFTNPEFAPESPHKYHATSWNDVMNACMVELAIAMLEAKDE